MKETRLFPTARGGALLLSLSFLSVLGLPAFGQSQAVNPAKDVRNVDDSEITHALEGAFWRDAAVDANEIDVTTADGIVTFTGTVDSILAKERAVRIAESTVGVRGVVNRLDVAPAPDRTDSDIDKAVLEALDRDPATRSYDIGSAVKNGEVTLTGTVDSWQEGQLAIAVAKGVRGVRAVHDQIKTVWSDHRPDDEIQSEIEERLKNDVRVDDLLVNVAVNQGSVTLSGVVGSLREKTQAYEDAWVAGVNSVDRDGLKIEWWARERMERNPNYIARTDEEIHNAVKDAYIYDPRVESFHPEVDVADGTVTLSGTVDNLSARQAAASDARNVAGVRRVINYLKVQPPGVTAGTDLAARVAEAFHDDPYLNRWDITIRAYSGRIYLSGTVGTSFEKQRASRDASRVSGVKEVINSLNYDRAWTWKSDDAISEDLHDELFWSPFVNPKNVSVAVDHGVVTLSGKVHDWSARTAAGDDALEAGAREVHNLLTVAVKTNGPYDNYWLPLY